MCTMNMFLAKSSLRPVTFMRDSSHLSIDPIDRSTTIQSGTLTMPSGVAGSRVAISFESLPRDI